jgi:hypothetical protein
MPDWFPFLTLALGYGARSLTDWIQHRRTVAREREVRNATRHDQLFERRTTFQRETLLVLQEVMMDLGRATAHVNHLDAMAIRNTGKRQRLPEDLDEGYRLAQAKASMLAARVRDDATRELVDQFRNLSSTCVTTKTQDESDKALNAAFQIHDQLNQRIGELLRTIDDADDAAIAPTAQRGR